MTEKEVLVDLLADPDYSILQHFHLAETMGRLELLFSDGLRVLGISKEKLRRADGFNLDTYNLENFESARAVLRLAVALDSQGFTNVRLVNRAGLADLRCERDGHAWYVEVKTLILQTEPRQFEIGGERVEFVVDKFQPVTCNIAHYVENVSRFLAADHVPKARAQLLRTQEELGPGKTMVAIVVNWFNAGFFLEEGHFNDISARLRGRHNGWEMDYMRGIDALAIMTNALWTGFV